jgi:hypothetical protein
MPFNKQLTRLLANDASLIAENWAAGNLDDALAYAIAARYAARAVENAIRRDREQGGRRGLWRRLLRG